jgi:hypothetical protein
MLEVGTNVIKNQQIEKNTNASLFLLEKAYNIRHKNKPAPKRAR